MSVLRIHIHINSLFEVLGLTGKLPFSIIYGLQRRLPADTDPRPILLETAGSVLYAPCALEHGLLILDVQTPSTQWVAVCISILKQRLAVEKAEYLSLPSPVARTEHWRDAYTIYQSHINISKELRAILQPGKRYVIRVASRNLGVERWTYSDRQHFADDKERMPRDGFEVVKLINSKPTGGSAEFGVTESLPWPPGVKTSLRLTATSPLLKPPMQT